MGSKKHQNGAWRKLCALFLLNFLNIYQNSSHIAKFIQSYLNCLSVHATTKRLRKPHTDCTINLSPVGEHQVLARGRCLLAFSPSSNFGKLTKKNVDIIERVFYNLGIATECGRLGGVLWGKKSIRKKLLSW